MRQLTDSECEALPSRQKVWQMYLAAEEVVDPWSGYVGGFEAGFIAALDHAATQLAALQDENKELTFANGLAAETCQKLQAESEELRTALAQCAALLGDSVAIEAALREEVERLREALEPFAAGE